VSYCNAVSITSPKCLVPCTCALLEWRRYSSVTLCLGAFVQPCTYPRIRASAYLGRVRACLETFRYKSWTVRCDNELQNCVFASGFLPNSGRSFGNDRIPWASEICQPHKTYTTAKRQCVVMIHQRCLNSMRFHKFCAAAGIRHG
jgi:hypothetical protein